MQAVWLSSSRIDVPPTDRCLGFTGIFTDKKKKDIRCVCSSFTGCTSVPFHQHHSVSCLWFSSSLMCNLQWSRCVRAHVRARGPACSLPAAGAITCPRFNKRQSDAALLSPRRRAPAESRRAQQAHGGSCACADRGFYPLSGRMQQSLNVK